MKKTLVIGSTVADVIINIEKMPRAAEDVHVTSQKIALGGCAYNASELLRLLKVPYTLFSPVGSGMYGDFVEQALVKKGITSPIPKQSRENGCCYCLVDDEGERTFLSCHGIEYCFEKEWFELLNVEEYGAVYVCGLELEEKSGALIVEFLEAHPELLIYLAPGPRIGKIDPALMERLYALHPVLHLNEEEACNYEGVDLVEAAARKLFLRTGAAVIITLGPDGAYYFDGRKALYLPGYQLKAVDTIGAGDAHIGTVMACVTIGDSLVEAVKKANQVAATVVMNEGAGIPEKVWERLKPSLCGEAV